MHIQNPSNATKQMKSSLLYIQTIVWKVVQHIDLYLSILSHTLSLTTPLFPFIFSCTFFLRHFPRSLQPPPPPPPLPLYSCVRYVAQCNTDTVAVNTDHLEPVRSVLVRRSTGQFWWIRHEAINSTWLRQRSSWAQRNRFGNTHSTSDNNIGTHRCGTFFFAAYATKNCLHCSARDVASFLTNIGPILNSKTPKLRKKHQFLPVDPYPDIYPEGTWQPLSSHRCLIVR